MITRPSVEMALSTKARTVTAEMHQHRYAVNGCHYTAYRFDSKLGWIDHPLSLPPLPLLSSPLIASPLFLYICPET